jgi:protein O-GlcNAcase/histone acetyltransferase
LDISGFSKGWRETFSSGDQEPWVFRGGLTADLQRLMPVDSGNDLFIYKFPDTPTTNFYTIRPYTHLDEIEVYSICHKTCRDGSDCSDLFPEPYHTIPADRLAGPFVTINPELCMVVQCPTGELLGYACAALDAKIFYRSQEMCWLPAMCVKYPLSLLGSPDLTPTAKDSINHFHNFKYDYPQEVLNTHPSIMTCSILKEDAANDTSIAKRLVTVLLAALRSNGSFGVHVCINTTDGYMHQFYTKLGFTDIYEDVTNGRVFLGRNF